MRLNRERLEAKFRDIRKAEERLSKFLKIRKEDFLSNEDFIHIARSHLLIAAEASIGICFHIAAKKLKQAIREYTSCFELLEKNNLLTGELSRFMGKLIGLRNRIVHRYDEVDYGLIYDNLRDIINNLDKLIAEVSRLLLNEEKESDEKTH
ncbi:MAG: type VII toxin-antitoxin system HepT family RNase toxin [Thermodesulfovibrionales bacterium]